METTITKKPANLPQIFAGILFMLFAVSGIIEKLVLIINLLMQYKTPVLSHNFSNIFKHSILPNIIMIVLYAVILIMSIFVSIGKPRIMTSITLGFTAVFFLVVGILSLLSTIGNIQTLLSINRYGFDSISKTIHTLLFVRNLFLTLGALVMLLAFIVAAILTLIGFIKKSKTPLWPVPGIISAVGVVLIFVYEVFYAFHNPLMAVMLSLDGHYYASQQFNNPLLSVLPLIISIVSMIGYLSACIGLFLVCKASKND